MDFFEHQRAARKQTGRLVLLFIVAVVAIQLGVYGLFTLIDVAGARTGAAPVRPFDLARLGLSAALVSVLVGVGSAGKIAQLSSGGRVVAESLRGRLLIPDGASLEERRVLNVVEEMAIASGAPVPPVYIMDGEKGINAFAAGLTAKDAVVGVSRGAVEQFSRHELQGVMAHEFSHILNGDMRLNVRLIGVLHGILALSLFGRTLLRFGFHEARWSRRGRDNNSVGAAAGIFGLGLVVLGSIGAFFARWIQSAVSRQREFLADASAVQYTRSVDGIAAALERIARFEHGTQLEAPRTEEVEHMLFGDGSRGFLNSIFATHPPTKERVRRLRGLPRTALDKLGIAGDGSALPAARRPRVGGESPAQVLGLTDVQTDLDWDDSELVNEAAGTLTHEEVDYAVELLESIPPALRSASHEAFGARALVYVLLLATDPELRAAELSRLEAHADARTFTLVLRIEPATVDLDPRLRLPLLDLASRSLREMSRAQYRAFRANLEVLIQSDGRVAPFELALRATVINQLDPLHGQRRLAAQRNVPLSERRGEVHAVLSLVSHAAGLGRDGAEALAAEAYASGRAHLYPEPPEQLLPRIEAERQFERALAELVRLKPFAKRDLLQALWLSISTDDELRVLEVELFRAVSETLACPMPPLLSARPIATSL